MPSDEPVPANEPVPSSEPADSDQALVRIDPAELEIALRVLDSLSLLEEDDPDFVTVRRATAKMFKAVKKEGRLKKRGAIADADRAVVAATATGAPDRIDDETRGIPLATSAEAHIAGTRYTLIRVG